MKQATFALAFMLAFFGIAASHASAATCGNPNLNRPFSQTVSTSTDPVTYDIVYSTTTVDAIDNVSCDNGMPSSVHTVWGTNLTLPAIKQGTTFKLSNGMDSTCPWWFPMACVDISHTVLWISWYGAK